MNATPGPVINAARIDILDLLGRYADAVMRSDQDDWIDCWGSNPTWNRGGQIVSGRNALLETWHDIRRRYTPVVHTIHPGRIAVRNGSARGRCTVQELLKCEDGSARQVVGVYHDDFEPADVGWRFQSRRFDMLMSRAIDLGNAELRSWPAGLEDFIDR